ncbi:MAG: aldehyde dehydrogenase family protein [Acidimicrobiia bacterium]|nr:aldehyde dehydrogenase family protein [Acidimicrobiia bacterium]
MLIDGELVEASGGVRFDVVNPATEEVAGTCADGTVDDMNRAIGAARRAFDESGWSTDVALRRRCLQQLKDELDREKETLRPLIVAEAGTPVLLTYAVQQDSCIDDMQWDIDLLDRYEWERELGEHEFFGMRSNRVVVKEPLGVAGLVTPWNFPFMLNLSKLTPALAAGNTVVLKPAPDTPSNATFLGRIIAEQTDIPAGVVNIVTGEDPAAIGEVLISDPRVDMVSFTGSTAVGKHIMEVGSRTLKRVFLELGGKSANIVLDDADFPTVVGNGAMMCTHAGQGCAITTRMLLPRSRYDEGVDLLRESFETFAYGDPTDPAHMMGPLINSRQRDRVLGLIDTGRREGARLLVGGGVPDHLERGYFVEPTVFVDVDPDATIAQEEIFGPVLAVIPYDDDDDAVRIANNSRYGLSGAVTGADLDRAMGIARRIRTGTVSVNGGQWFGPDTPFGGYRSSGIGREHGVEGFEEYLETKAIGYPV